MPFAADQTIQNALFPPPPTELRNTSHKVFYTPELLCNIIAH
jgi:hypothetical protein